VSSDSPEDAKALVHKLGLSFEVIPDPELQIAAAFGVRQADKESALPSTFVIAPDGKIAWRKVGENIPDRPTIFEITSALSEIK
jgi:peroxiredoxin